jgi:hypothetical protein
VKKVDKTTADKKDDGPIISKKFGGSERGQIAREELKLIFNDPTNPLYFLKDIDYAGKFNVTRLTVYNIRKNLKVPSRSVRILQVLGKMKTSRLTLKEMSEKLGIKYQNLYKLVTDNNIPFKKEQPSP